VKSVTSVCQDNLAFRVYDGFAAERSLAVLGSCYKAARESNLMLKQYFSTSESLL
jgi:hypothetical protein